jgi:hypothetical protein
MAADEAGERLIAAALLADARACAVDASRRLDGQSVLLVAGYLVGTTGIALKANLARSLGASHIWAAFLGETDAKVQGCDEVTSLDVAMPAQ